MTADRGQISSITSAKTAIPSSTSAYVKSDFRAYGVDPAVIYHDGVYYDELLMARQL